MRGDPDTENQMNISRETTKKRKMKEIDGPMAQEDDLAKKFEGPMGKEMDRVSNLKDNPLEVEVTVSKNQKKRKTKEERKEKKKAKEKKMSERIRRWLLKLAEYHRQSTENLDAQALEKRAQLYEKLKQKLPPHLFRGNQPRIEPTPIHKYSGVHLQEMIERLEGAAELRLELKSLDQNMQGTQGKQKSHKDQGISAKQGDVLENQEAP